MQNKEQVIYTYFEGHGGRFFKTDDQKTILLFKGKTFEIGDNPEFNKLVAGLNLF